MDLEHLLLAAVILLAAVCAALTLSRGLGLGSVLGLLAAGVAVGPSGFAVTSEVETLREFTEIGVVLLLFTIGLEMRPAMLWSMRRAVFGLGVLQIGLSGAVIGAYALIFVGSWQVALLVGLGLALSSTAFVMQLLGERGDLATEHGRNAFAVLLMQDLAIVPLLALVPVLSGQDASADRAAWHEALLVAGALAGVYLFGRFVLPAALQLAARQRNREAFGALALLAVLGSAWMMEQVGLSMALGAFLMGMALSGCRYRYQLEALIEPVKLVLLSLFFVSVGMSVDLGLLARDPGTVFMHVGALLTLKAGVLFGLSLAFGLSLKTAIRLALLLSQSGEFGFVLFGAALAAGLIGAEEFGQAVLVISVTMAATPFLARLADRFVVWFAGAGVSPSAAAPAPLEHEGHVLVAGYGRTGRTVCLMLDNVQIPYVAFDLDLERVSLGKREGRPVHYGDVSHPALLGVAGVGRASAVVVTVGRTHTVERLVSTIRNLYPAVPVIAEARDLGAWERIAASGATLVVPAWAEASLDLGEAVLQRLGVEAERLSVLRENLRKADYALLRQQLSEGRQERR